MIGKVFLTGKTFGETCAYVLRHQSEGVVLDVVGVRRYNHKVMAADFEWQHHLMPEKEKPVFHGVLSFPSGEWVADGKLVELGRKYMEKIGMVDTQYAFVKHMDKEHLHVHIVANRVNNYGKPIGKGLIIERSIKAAKELTLEYGLRQESGKRLEQTHLDALHEPDAKRYRIYQAIKEQLPRCCRIDDLERGLRENGITVRYRCDERTGKRQGISFRLENRSFKGSQVDKAYSLSRLERTLALQERQVQENRLRKLLTESKALLSKEKRIRWEEPVEERKEDLRLAQHEGPGQAQEHGDRQEEKLQPVQKVRLRLEQEEKPAQVQMQRRAYRQSL